MFSALQNEREAIELHGRTKTEPRGERGKNKKKVRSETEEMEETMDRKICADNLENKGANRSRGLQIGT